MFVSYELSGGRAVKAHVIIDLFEGKMADDMRIWIVLFGDDRSGEAGIGLSCFV